MPERIKIQKEHSKQTSKKAKISTTEPKNKIIRKKLVIVGDDGVGKSSLLSVYATGKFQGGLISDIPENYIKRINYEGQKVILEH